MYVCMRMIGMVEWLVVVCVFGLCGDDCNGSEWSNGLSVYMCIWLPLVDVVTVSDFALAQQVQLVVRLQPGL